MSAKKKTLQKLPQTLCTPLHSLSGMVSANGPAAEPHPEGHTCTIGNAGIEDDQGPFSPYNNKDHLQQGKPLAQVSQTFSTEMHMFI